MIWRSYRLNVAVTVPAAVAAALITKVVALVIDATYAPAGIPVPVTAAPTEINAVDAVVTLVLAFVVVTEEL